MLSCGKTRLSGTVPPTISNPKRLQYLWLNDNDLHGEIPKEIRSLNSLKSLRLHGNRFVNDPSDSRALPCLPRTITEFTIYPEKF